MTNAAIEEVVPGLHRIDLGLVNAYVLDGGDGPVLVDAGLPGDGVRILDALEAIDAGPLQRIVVTHAHPDHAGGAATVREATGAPIAMHPWDAALVAEGRTGRPLRATPGFEDRVPAQLLASFPIDPLTVDATLLPGGGIDEVPGVTVLSAPGHSAGQVVLRWDRHGGVLLAADAAANHGTIALPRVCEDAWVTRRTLARLHRLAVDVAVFGHGEPVVGGADGALRAAAAELTPATSARLP
jgi:glyoxylase-like metal-dependent hydrolase (beta-lactamase superfamily II)